MAKKLKPTTDENGTKKIPERLKKIAGIVKLPEGFDEKKELRAYFENKHLNNL